ncbi:MAG: protease modulator HflC [Rhodospirillales bacterium]|jgi:modulator of FtsH protease HflC|nr:protease modulator HflC [Rhodospirillales bacterium]
MRASQLAIGVVVIVLGLLAFSTLYTVHQAEQAIVLQFGKPVNVVKEPGLHFKIPFVQNVQTFDQRVLDFDAAAEEVPTRDQKQLVVDAFARYRIVDPLMFFQTVNNIAGMENRLGSVINASLREVFGDVALARLLTQERSALMKVIAERVNEEGEAFGINVIDVRIKRVDLPEENSQAIFNRMQTQREQAARKIRAEGGKESKRIHADADKQRTVIEANAHMQSEILRGEGEAGAQKIYNDAYGRDQKFFDFWVSMDALRQGLQGGNTRYVGPPDNDFFRFFGDITGGAEKK